MHHDGHGLYLVVKPTGARSWIFRFQLNGRRRDAGLGPWPIVTLAEAREKADEARRLVYEKRDPITTRRQRQGLTFKEAAERLIESKAPGWRSSKHSDQWRSTLIAYVYPRLGDLDVGHVDTVAVLDVLRPIWTRVPETASRVRQRVDAVLAYATALEARGGDNPARWKNHLDHLLPRPSKVRAVEHFKAMDWRQMPIFWQLLVKQEGVAALALQFVILTAARSGEVRGMVWAEVDDDLWTVPAARMKTAKEHRVPLTEPALLILESVRPLGPHLVFPGAKRSQPLSDMSLTAVLRRMYEQKLISPITVHGFRSSFRDWAGEATSHPREVIEAALAHRLRDKAEAAYARGDLLDKRRKLLKDWANFVCNK
jgi:integrase